MLAVAFSGVVTKGLAMKRAISHYIIVLQRKSKTPRAVTLQGVNIAGKLYRKRVLQGCNCNCKTDIMQK